MPDFITNIPRFCPNCGQGINASDAFCVHCGKQLVDLPIGIGKKIYMYAISILLPPFGIVYFFKYFRSQNPDLKKVGTISLILTIIATIATIWMFVGFMQGVQNSLSSYSSLGI